MAKPIKIVFTGGGTGGHIMPIIAIGREIKRLQATQDLALHYIGPQDKASLFALSQEGFKMHHIVTGKIRRYFSLQNFVDIIVKMPFGYFQSLGILLFMRPKLVFSKGGSGSHVVVLAAKTLGIAAFIHESDSVPGLSNKACATAAKKIFTSFPKTEYFDPVKTMLVGNPIKKELLEGTIPDAREIFNLTLEKPILLFLGGSQGAQPLNDFILNMLNAMLEHYEVIHVTGEKNYLRVRQESDAIIDQNLLPYYHPKPLLNEIELKHAYAAANVIISRGGAGSIFEIAACEKPSILIPLPGSAGDHQSKNAYQYAATGAAEVLEQENLSPNFFLGKIGYLLENTQKVEAMKEAALAFSKPLAAKAIAREILEYIENHEKK